MAALAAAVVNTAGDVASIAQSAVHQKETIHWEKRCFHLKCQSLRLDALDHAKEEIRSHYDTYVGRIDTLLIVLALTWQYALCVIQWSERFVPQSAQQCPDCVEGIYWGLDYLWFTLIAFVLILPFWGILMLIRTKLKLDHWLEYSLAGLKRERLELVATWTPDQGQAEPAGEHSRTCVEKHDDDTERIVYKVVKIVFRYQEYLARIWAAECSRLVYAATMFLWMSAVMALIATALAMWDFIVNRSSIHSNASGSYGLVIGTGLLAPAMYMCVQQYFDKYGRPLRYKSKHSAFETPALHRSCSVSGPLTRVSARYE